MTLPNIRRYPDIVLREYPVGVPTLSNHVATMWVNQKEVQLLRTAGVYLNNASAERICTNNKTCANNDTECSGRPPIRNP